MNSRPAAKPAWMASHYLGGRSKQCSSGLWEAQASAVFEGFHKVLPYLARRRTAYSPSSYATHSSKKPAASSWMVTG